MWQFRLGVSYIVAISGQSSCKLPRHLSLLMGLSMVSVHRLVWASLQDGSLRAAGLFT